MFERKGVSEDHLYRAIEAVARRLERYVSIIEISEHMDCEPSMVSGPLHSLIEKGLVTHAKDKGLYFRVVPKGFVKLPSKKVARPRRKKEESEKYTQFGFEIIRVM